MDRELGSGYDPSQVEVVPSPEGREVGDGWWRVRWLLSVESNEALTGVHLPVPDTHLGDLTMIVALLPNRSGELELEVLIRHPRLEWNEFGYILLILRLIRSHLGHMTVRAAD